MSSMSELKFKEPITLKEWKKFCSDFGIRYSPNTVGRNTFYNGDTEICFGECNWEELPKTPTGQLDFSKATPFDEAKKITVSTYFCGNLEGVVQVINWIKKEFKGRISSQYHASEIKATMKWIKEGRKS